MQGPNNYNGFYIYIGKKISFSLLKNTNLFLLPGLMLLYLSCVQIFITTFIYLTPFSNAFTTISSIIVSAFFLSAGYVVHFKDSTIYTSWIQYISPTSWLFPYLINRELTPDAIASSSATTLCRNKQVKINNSFKHYFNYF